MQSTTHATGKSHYGCRQSPVLSVATACVSLSALAFLLGTTNALAQCGGYWLDNPTTQRPEPARLECLTTWDPDGAGPQPTLLAAGGEFLNLSGQPVYGVGVWDGVEWRLLDNGWPSGSTSVLALIVHNGDLVVGGRLSSNDADRRATIARWDGTTWVAIGLGLSPNATVRALGSNRGTLFAGGGPGILSPFGVLHAIAAWNGSVWTPLGHIGTSGAVYALGESNGRMYSGGLFNSIDFQPMRNVAALTLEQWYPVGFGLPSEIRSLTTHNGRLFAGGYLFVAGDNGGYVAEWDGTSWLKVGWPLNQRVNFVIDYRGRLVIGGDFDADISGEVVRKIARLAGEQWTPMNYGFNNSTVRAATVFRDELVIGGLFDQGGNDNSQRQPSWARWTDTGVPWLARNPVNATTTPCGTATISVRIAAGYDTTQRPLTHRWQVLSPITQTWSDLAEGQNQSENGVGGTFRARQVATPDLVLDQWSNSPVDFPLRSTFQFRCIISHLCLISPLISNPATVTICISDTDNGTGSGTCDGGVTIDDLLYFLSIFEQGLPRADIDDGSSTGTPDGGVTIDDLLYYLSRFEAGC